MIDFKNLNTLHQQFNITYEINNASKRNSSKELFGFTGKIKGSAILIQANIVEDWVRNLAAYSL